MNRNAMAKFADKTPVDFVIVGAGGAGGVIAKELSSAEFQVVVLEQGPYLHEGDFAHDELKFKDIFDSPFIGREVITNDHSLQPNTFRKTESEKAALSAFAQYGQCVGGGTVQFTGNYWRFHELDFVELSRWGAVEGAGVADWPITYSDLELYYTKAEWELGVSGLAGANPFDPPRSKPYPLPPLPVKSSGVLLERGARKLGWHPYPAPLAILSQPYQGRSACEHCGFCESFGCEWGAKSSTLASVIPIAEKTGHCEIRPNSYVRKISTDNKGRVDGVLYFDVHKLYFIDHFLARFDRDKQPAYTQGLNDLRNSTQQLFSSASRFSSLAPAQQIQVLTAIEKTDFFEIVRLHTIMMTCASRAPGSSSPGMICVAIASTSTAWAGEKNSNLGGCSESAARWACS